jgi:hypothetical protein
VRLDHLLSKELKKFLVEATDRTCRQRHGSAHCSALKERKAACGPPFCLHDHQERTALRRCLCLGGSVTGRHYIESMRRAPGGVGAFRPAFSEEQRGVLTGTLLGDGCLSQHGRFHRLHVKHKTQHRSLAELKYRAFANYISMPLHEFDQQLRGKKYPCVQFASLTSPEFSEWHSYFYRGGRKIVPADIAQHLSPLAVAVWFMDDGASDHAGVTIQTHCFDLEEVRLLVQSLAESCRVTASLRRNKGAWIIYVGAAELSAFRKLVRPYILPELGYKLVPRSILGKSDR